MTTAPIPTSLATACAAHDRHRLDVLDALLDEAAPSAVRELLGAALDLCASLRADRDALRAKLDAAPKVCAIHSYEHGPGPCMTCGAWPPGTRELIATCRTRIAGLEQAADERSAEVARLTDRVAGLEQAKSCQREAWQRLLDAVDPDAITTDDALRAVARLTARVAELEARPVLTVDLYRERVNRMPGRAEQIVALLGPVTLPAQDRAEELYRAYLEAQKGWNGVVTVDAARAVMADAMRRALASLGAPPTSPTAARPVFAGVSEDELIRLFYVVGTDGIDHGENCPPIDSSDRNGIRAVLARLEVSLVAPVDPEAFARSYHDHKDAPAPEWDEVDIWRSRDQDEQRAAADAMRATLIARGIPVTPEVGKMEPDVARRLAHAIHAAADAAEES